MELPIVGGRGYAKIFYRLEYITRTANHMQLICSMLICQKNPWFDANISWLKSSKNFLTHAELVISVDLGVVLLSVTLELHSPTILFVIISGYNVLSDYCHCLLSFFQNFKLLYPRKK